MFYGKLADVTPDMEELQKYPDTVREALVWLKENDWRDLPLGKTEIDGERIFISNAEYQTKSACQAVLESHRKYIDIQLVVSGEEWMGCAPCTADLPVLGEGYSEENDVVFYPQSVMPFWLSGETSEQKKLVRAGEFCVFSPEDVHASQIFHEAPAQTRKIVVKCRV